MPDDAAVVVVAEPQTPARRRGRRGASSKYMTEPRPDGRKGKLIVLAGAGAGPNDKGVLEDRAGGAAGRVQRPARGQVRLQRPDRADSRTTGRSLVGFATAAEQNPITQTRRPAGRGRSCSLLPREVDATDRPTRRSRRPRSCSDHPRPAHLAGGRPASPTSNRPLQRPAEPEAVRMRQGPDPDRRGRSPSVVSEGRGGSRPPAPGRAGRVVVIGNSAVFTDRYAERGPRRRPATFDLVAVGHRLAPRPPAARHRGREQGVQGVPVPGARRRWTRPGSCGSRSGSACWP